MYLHIFALLYAFLFCILVAFFYFRPDFPKLFLQVWPSWICLDLLIWERSPSVSWHMWLGLQRVGLPSKAQSGQTCVCSTTRWINNGQIRLQHDEFIWVTLVQVIPCQCFAKVHNCFPYSHPLNSALMTFQQRRCLALWWSCAFWSAATCATTITSCRWKTTDAHNGCEKCRCWLLKTPQKFLNTTTLTRH